MQPSTHHGGATASRSAGTPAVQAVQALHALQVLRDRTRTAHEQLDAALTGPSGRISDTTGYVRLLTGLSSLHARTDEPLRAWTAGSDWARAHLDPADLPRRTALYASDRAALGAADRTAEPGSPSCDDGQALGFLYVVAGSTAGARLVLRGLPDDLAPHARAGLSDAAAPAGARLWRDCRTALTAPLPEELVARAADEAALLFRLVREAVR